jgi:hypothetical protein
MKNHSFKEPGVFGPEGIAVISKAYAVALKELRDTGQPQIVREIIAGRIIAAARTGERDPVRLREAALPWLARQRN